MPNFDDAAGTIRSAFGTGFAAYPIAYENVAFDPPVDGSGNPTPYVHLWIMEGEARVAGYTGRANLYRHPGVVKVQIFTAANTGDGLSREIGDLVAAVFRGQDLSGVHFRAPYYTRVGENGAYWLATVTCVFEYDLIV